LPVALDTYWQVHREIAGDLSPFGLTTPQYLVLVHLVAGRREAGMRQLARAGRHDPATMTAVVDGLVQRGWVVRRRSPVDRRRVVVRLTPRGGARTSWRRAASFCAGDVPCGPSPGPSSCNC
jgi:DNA-binding MarR family transcriptional regulator